MLFVVGEQSRHLIQLFASLYPDSLPLYVDLLRTASLFLERVVLKRLGDDVLYMGMHIRAKLMEDVPDPRTHRRYPELFYAAGGPFKPSFGLSGHIPLALRSTNELWRWSATERDEMCSSGG